MSKPDNKCPASCIDRPKGSCLMAATNDSATSAALAAENWRLRNILAGIQAAIDPDKKLSQPELVGRAWELAQAKQLNLTEKHHEQPTRI